MTRRGQRWEVEMEVEAGAHHYGYLVDGEWYVPEDDRSLVPDEWGRMTALLVIVFAFTVQLAISFIDRPRSK